MELTDISFASLSFDSSNCFDIICGSNGLPVTPNSIKIIGNFKAQIEHESHPNLTRYVDCFRNKEERVTLVFESLLGKPPEEINYPKVAKQILTALDHVHNYMKTYHGLLTPECIAWTRSGDIKLAHWPLNLLTNGGFCLNTKTILPPKLNYIAPEQVKHISKVPSQSCDIWSAGLILLKLIKPSCKLHENPCRIAFCDSAQRVLSLVEGILNDDDVQHSDIWNKFFDRCLDPDPENRASISELITIIEPLIIVNGNLGYAEQNLDPIIHFDVNPLKDNCVPLKTGLKNEISSLDIAEIYHLWRLSIGRNFESEQRQDDNPPIFKIPYLIVSERHLTSESEPKLLNFFHLDYNTTKLIPFERFKSDIEKLDKKIFQPVLTSEQDYPYANHRSSIDFFQGSSPIHHNQGDKNYNTTNIEARKGSDTFTFADLDTISIKSNIRLQIEESSKTLPIVIKEANFAYQCERIVLFKRLLNEDADREMLIRESSIDIPPYFRAQVWARLLDVDKEESERLYASIDKTASAATERQISVDIPRCHQYNELMASPQGHQKLARILKAWLNHNSNDYVYWQGLDSLASPFLLLNFQDEALAFACFNAFIDKYLNGMFRQVNQLNVQQYLDMFSKLLAYHDPKMSEHLISLGFLPNLYAIPWFLTMFTHVLPLHKILHVWDCLMLGDEKYPLCIGLAILNQLKSELMGFTFNDCLGIFSDLPEIDIERCIKDANHFYCTTPDKLINLFDIEAL